MGCSDNMKKLYIDFETRSRVDIFESGAAKYAASPSTEILCLAYAIDDGPVQIIRREDIILYPLVDPFEELRNLSNNKEYIFYAHNSIFEQLIYKHILTTRFGFNTLPVNRWRCTAAKALSVGLPKSLEDAAKALDAAYQKDLSGRQTMLRLCKPQANGQFIESAEQFAKLEAYCTQDVETERAIDKALPELHPFEQYVWFEDQVINHRGVHVDTVALAKCLETIEKETKRLKEVAKTLSGGLLDGTSRRQAVLDYLKKKHGVVLPDFTKATVEKAITEGKIPQEALELLRVRQQSGLTSTAKYIALNNAIDDDGRLRDAFIYYTAGTGRWGGKLVQLQNLPKPKFDSDLGVEMILAYDYETLRIMYPNIMELLSSCVRGMFAAAKGKELLVADYSAIEARVLMWFCDEVEAVQMFREGKDIYVEMAKRISRDAPRQLGKQAILACGYGMGDKKFKTTCETYDIQVSETLAKAAVNAYRATYPKVRNMWYAQERAAIQAVSKGGRIACGRVEWEKRGNFLWCRLPSGRSLAYHKPEVKTSESDFGEQSRLTYMATDSMTKQYIRKDTYGGKIIENIIQATARDILANALIEAERKGFPPVMHVHDEIVVEVPEGKGDVQEFVKTICALPKWAEGCPITAEGWKGTRYKK